MSCIEATTTLNETDDDPTRLRTGVTILSLTILSMNSPAHRAIAYLKESPPSRKVSLAMYEEVQSGTTLRGKLLSGNI